MSSPVLISTHTLPRAGELRDAFRDEGYTAELVTPDEELDVADEPTILVLTTGEAVDPEDPLVQQARRLDVPVLAQVDDRDAVRGTEPVEGLFEIFGPDAGADEIALVGRRILERRRLQEITGIVGETDAMREVLERVIQIAPVDSTVLVTGESGTGKELVARGIHALSPRRHKPFIAVNVAALSDTLLESELFGHEKGAFTGAVDARKGLFELAHGGTIFLDEIGEMPLTTQTKLLRVLEQREFHRVGGETSIRVDVRILAATNQDLRRLVALREFRKDLYYRLNVLNIELPALKDRPRDIPLLVKAFQREIGERHDREFPGITDEAMEILKEHHWPGNVRELRNLVESMVVLAPGRQIRPADIPPEVRGERRGTALVHTRPPQRLVAGDEDGSVRPQLEFIFRMLMELRVDIDDLRREFEAYQEEVGAMEPGRGLELIASEKEGSDLVRLRRVGGGAEGEGVVVDVDEVEARPTREERGETPDEEPSPGEPEEEAEEDTVVVYRPGMTMEDLEREAIAAALVEVEGNRRRAAELLGIGERTLYRKLRKYDLDA